MIIITKAELNYPPPRRISFNFCNSPSRFLMSRVIISNYANRIITLTTIGGAFLLSFVSVYLSQKSSSSKIQNLRQISSSLISIQTEINRLRCLLETLGTSNQIVVQARYSNLTSQFIFQ